MLDRQRPSVHREVVSGLEDDHIRLELRDLQLQSKQRRLGGVSGNSGVDVIECERRPMPMNSFHDQCRPSHGVAADLGAVGRRGAEKSDAQLARRFFPGNLRAAEAKGVDADRAKMAVGDRDAQSGRPIGLVGLVDSPKRAAVLDFAADTDRGFRGQQQQQADPQHHRREHCPALPGRQSVKAVRRGRVAHRGHSRRLQSGSNRSL